MRHTHTHTFRGTIFLSICPDRIFHSQPPIANFQFHFGFFLHSFVLFICSCSCLFDYPSMLLVGWLVVMTVFVDVVFIIKYIIMWFLALKFISNPFEAIDPWNRIHFAGLLKNNMLRPTAFYERLRIVS